MIKQHFFELLRSGLWGHPPNPLGFEQADWGQLYQISLKQTVYGIILDGISLLPKNLQPPLAIRLKWISLITKLESENAVMNRRITELVTIYNSSEVLPILIKGQSMATRYIHPLHRVCGDVDLLMAQPEQLQKANEWAKLNGRVIEQSGKVLLFEWRGIFVENHNRLATICNKKLEKKLVDITRRELLSTAETQRKCRIEDVEIDELPSTLYAFFLLLHMSLHIVEGGVGLRQVCDWAVFLKEEKSGIDCEKFQYWLDELEMWKLAYVFGQICVDHIGLDKKMLPFNLVRNNRAQQTVMNDMFKGGNFGQCYYAENNLSKTRELWIKFRVRTVRNMYIYQLWPSEVRVWYGDIIKKGLKRVFINKY